MNDVEAKDNARKVRPDSLPLCLSHLTRQGALDDAMDIAAFLKTTAEALMNPDDLIAGNVSATERSGMVLCFELMLDKMNIARGNYHFPLMGEKEDSELCKREVWA